MNWIKNKSKMIYLKNYKRDLENKRVSDASERYGAGHLSATESMAYNVTQMNVKGK